MRKLLFLFVVFLLVLIATYNTPADVNKGIISAWTFDDETAKDSIGKGDGKINGGVEFVKGKFGKAAKMDQPSSLVRLIFQKRTIYQQK